MEPAEVTVIVHSANNLKGKKKDRHKYSVIFGCGNNKYRTQIVVEPSGCPVWNEESVVTVDKSNKPLKFKVTEKEDVLGQVVVPLDDVSRARTFTSHTCDLRPHRKCPKPQGQLVFECWVSKQRDQMQPKIRGSTESLNRIKASPFSKIKSRLSASPLVSNKLGSKGAKLSPGQRATQSMFDIASAPKGQSFSLERNVPFGSIDLDDSDDDEFFRNSPSRMSMNSDIISQPIQEVSSPTKPEADLPPPASPTKSKPPAKPARRNKNGNPFGATAYEDPFEKDTPQTIMEPSMVDSMKTLDSIQRQDKSNYNPFEETKPAEEKENRAFTVSTGGDLKPKRQTSAFYDEDVTDWISVNPEIAHDTESNALNVNPLPTKVMAVKPLQASSPKMGKSKKSSSYTDLTKVEAAAPPEITGISPREGPIEGGTRLTIRGMNLGKNHHDVIGLFVCGASCLGTLEFESPKKIFCVTKQWKPCVGTIDIETRSGGKASSLVQFTFVDNTPPAPPVIVEETKPEFIKPTTPILSAKGKGHKREASTGSIENVKKLSSLGSSPVPSPGPQRKGHRKTGSQGSGKEVAGDKHTDSPKKGPSVISLITGADAVASLEAQRQPPAPMAPPVQDDEQKRKLALEVKVLLQEKESLLSANQELKDENQRVLQENQNLRQYIDQLLAKVINRCPDTLCVDSIRGRTITS